MDSVAVPLTAPARAAIERIKAAGFADDDVGAIRVAIADLASRLGALSLPDPAVAPGSGTIVRSTAVSASVAAAAALEIVRNGRCTCRRSTGRHHVLLSLLTALANEGTANWLDVLRSAKASATRFNREVGLPESQAPAGVAYHPAGMSQNWMRAYISEGAGQFRERYSKHGPVVPTTSLSTGRGVRIDLQRER